MTIRRSDLDTLTGVDYQERKEVLENCIKNDTWARKALKNIGILVTSHPGNRAFLRACLESHSKLGYWITLAYDRGDLEGVPLDLVDLLLMPHKQTWGDDMYPWFWQLKFGAAAMQGFEYVYCVNGDFILEDPDGFPRLLEVLGNADVLTCGPDDEWECGSGGFIIKSKEFLRVVNHIQEHFILFDTYEKYIDKLPNSEARLCRAIKDLVLNQVSVRNPPESVLCYEPEGTWYSLVGFRHIHGELDWAYKRGLIPPHYKYMDEKYLDPVYKYPLIKEYWDTGNPKILERWWR